MMKRIYQISMLAVLLLGYCGSMHAEDTVFNRVVTVERDYQPELQDAQAVVTKPVFIQHEPELNPVVYSTYSNPLQVGYNLHTLDAAETKFRMVKSPKGVVDGSVGHRNTHFGFDYELLQKDDNSVAVYVKHDAYWGSDALSQQAVGAEYIRHLPKAELVVGLDVDNEAYRYYSDWQNLCTGQANIGFRSLSNYPFQFRVQVGYTAFSVSRLAVEHHAQSHLDLWWTDQRHSAGVKGYVQNTFYSGPPADISLPAMRHNIRIEPFYAYKDKQIRLHAGVNLDMNLGTGTMLSEIENLSFAPSPNVELEWSMLRNILHVYANAKGSFGMGTMAEYMEYNRYLNQEKGLEMALPRAYTPVDAQVGFKLRPIKTLLLDFYGGYAYMKNACNMKAILDAATLKYELWLSDYQYWKVGAQVHYHYRDIVELNAEGNYYFWNQAHYDRPDWDVRARVDVHFTPQISIYSDNYVCGARMAATSDGDKKIKPMVSLNFGAQWDISRNLSTYLQLNDYLNRRDELFYGYHSQGIHFLLGVKYKF